jgi:hypothetical protein
MFRRVFLAGIDDGHWGLIKDLHENAKSVIKWEGNISQPFQFNQEVAMYDCVKCRFYVILKFLPQVTTQNIRVFT